MHIYIYIYIISEPICIYKSLYIVYIGSYSLWVRAYEGNMNLCKLYYISSSEILISEDIPKTNVLFAYVFVLLSFAAFCCFCC